MFSILDCSLIDCRDVSCQSTNSFYPKKIGFEREQVLVLDNAKTLGDRAFTLKKELLNHSELSVSGYLPVPSYRSNSPLCSTQEIREDNCISIQMWNIDEAYIPTFRMEIVAGKNFSPEMFMDSNAVIINETAAQLFEFQDPIGKTILNYSLKCYI